MIVFPMPLQTMLQTNLLKAVSFAGENHSHSGAATMLETNLGLQLTGKSVDDAATKALLIVVGIGLQHSTTVVRHRQRI
jgi:hypothetical protein